MKRSYIVLGIFSLLLFSGCKFNESASLALSKEVCSCLYTVKQSASYCKSVTKESEILANYQAFPKDKLVIATGLDHLAAAAYQNDRIGCQVLKSKKIRKKRRRVGKRTTYKSPDNTKSFYAELKQENRI